MDIAGKPRSFVNCLSIHTLHKLSHWLLDAPRAASQSTLNISKKSHHVTSRLLGSNETTREIHVSEHTLSNNIAWLMLAFDSTVQH